MKSTWLISRKTTILIIILPISIQVVIDDVTRYNAFYGVYDSYSEAELSIQTLPTAVLRANPWIRNFRILHNMIKQ